MSQLPAENVQIRKAAREDAPVLISLLQALAEYEKLPGPDEDARRRLLKHGWPEDGSPPFFEAWLAELPEGTAAGGAFTSSNYSTFLAQPTLYLEDLFVLPGQLVEEGQVPPTLRRLGGFSDFGN